MGKNDKVPYLSCIILKALVNQEDDLFGIQSGLFD
jgi:hypothetical protein